MKTQLASLYRSPRLRCWLKCLAAILVPASLALGLLGIHRLGEALLFANRRVPGEWQSAVLDRPEHHGVVIERFSTFAEDGIGIQALLVRPSASGGESQRYREMRRRLGDESFVGTGDGEQPAAMPRRGGRTAEAPAPVRATVFLLHGRSGIKEDGITIAERFAAAGLATVLFDSRGHGESPEDQMSYGKREVDDLCNLIDAVRVRYRGFGNVGDVPLMIFGNSMGAAVALQALPRESRLRAAVVVSPFADLPDLTREMLKRRLPGGTSLGAAPLQVAVSAYSRVRAGFTLGDIRPERDAVQIRVPTMVVHGDCDRVIPIAHGRRVFAAIGDERKLWRPVVGGQHGDVLMHGGDDLYEEVVRFFLAAVAAEAQEKASQLASGS